MASPPSSPSSTASERLAKFAELSARGGDGSAVFSDEEDHGSGSMIPDTIYTSLNVLDMLRHALELSARPEEVLGGQLRPGEIDEAGDTQVMDDGEDVDAMSEAPVADGENIIEEAEAEETEPAFDTTGLREVSNLASWTVSTYKPGCGVAELRSDDTNLFWQSDGPQPHYLNIHFARFMKIRAIRMYLDFETDESYTPTRIQFVGGTGYHDLTQFANLAFQQPKGWIDVDLKGVGGGPDGNTLRVFLIRVKILENHQNGKDTHIRGMKIYALDDNTFGPETEGGELDFDNFFDTRASSKTEKENEDGSKPGTKKKSLLQRSMFTEPGWMKEPELR